MAMARGRHFRNYFAPGYPSRPSKSRQRSQYSSANYKYSSPSELMPVSAPVPVFVPAEVPPPGPSPQVFYDNSYYQENFEIMTPRPPTIKPKTVSPKTKNPTKSTPTSSNTQHEDDKLTKEEIMYILKTLDE